MGLFKKETAEKQATPEVKEEIKSANGSVIAEGVTFEGDFFTDEQLTIAGTVKGNIKSNVDTHIEKTGTHVGKMYVKTLHLDGTADSDVVCSEVANLGETANFKGTLTTPNIEAVHGSSFDGNLHLSSNLGKTANSEEVAAKDQ